MGAVTERTGASGEPGSAPGRGAALLGLTADELHWSRSERSSLDVVLEHVSRPLSVVVGLEMEEAALSEAGRLEEDKPCSMKGTPPSWTEVQSPAGRRGLTGTLGTAVT